MFGTPVFEGQMVIYLMFPYLIEESDQDSTILSSGRLILPQDGTSRKPNTTEGGSRSLPIISGHWKCPLVSFISKCSLIRLFSLWFLFFTYLWMISLLGNTGVKIKYAFFQRVLLFLLWGRANCPLKTTIIFFMQPNLQWS